MTSGSLSINQWAEEDRPREKLARLGASALSNAELLAILIGSGTPEKSAVDLMKEILADCGNNLNQLGKLSLAELQRYKGVGLAKAVTIQAACEMGRRRQVSRPEERPRMDSADAIYREMHPRMQDLDVEEAWVVLANQSFRLIKVLRLSHGGISETAVDVRVAQKANCPLGDVLYMPLDKAYLFVRGNRPKIVSKYDLTHHPKYPEVREAVV